MTLVTDALGQYRGRVLGGIYTVVAGPRSPGYPGSASANSVNVSTGVITTQDLQLNPVPALAEYSNSVDDNVAGSNQNGYPEPGESGLLLWEDLTNIGAASSTNITAELISLTLGVTISVPLAAYPDLAPGAHLTNLTPFIFSIDESVTCGTDLQFQKIVTDSVSTYSELQRQCLNPHAPHESLR